jgi:hypothetical protein
MIRIALISLLLAFAWPPACDAGQGAQASQADQSPTRQRPTAQAEAAGTISPGFVSIDRIRKGLRDNRSPGPALDPVRLPPRAPGVASTPIYRVEIVGYRPTTFQESLQAAVADRWAPARPGYLDGAPGLVRPATALIGGGVSVDPMSVVRVFRKWAHKQAAAKAKREVAEELDALLRAQAALAKNGPSK